jgi:broad specificity phosphatase PhoE
MGSGAVKPEAQAQIKDNAGPDVDSCAAPVRSIVDIESGSGDAQDRLHACFAKWDVDGSGTISVHVCGTPVSASNLGSLFAEIDLNKDGVIDYTEFVAWLYPSASRPSGGTSSPTRSKHATVPVPAPLPSSSGEELPKLPMKSGSGLFLLLHSASELPDYSSSYECDASATAFVSKGGQPMEPKAHWPCAKQCSNPCWNTARDLGWHTYTACADAKAAALLHIEMRGNNSLIGEVRLPLAEITMDHWYNLPLELTASRLKKADGTKKPCVRFMIMTEPAMVKKVFLVRHGESLWNKAQKEKKVSQLLEQVDHPLSDRGIQQCHQLASRIDARKDIVQHLKTNEAELMNAQICLSSPLTRAIQTALVGLHPILKHLSHLRLCANAREKHNLGGFDTTGTAKGEAEIVHRVHSALREGGAQDADIDRYLAIPLDSTEADNRWWNDSRESQSAVKERLQEFIGQMRFCREERIIVVGHSHFFRALIKQGLSSSAIIEGATRHDVQNKKLMNCGIAAITLDFRKGADQPITEVELMLGSELV